MDKEQIERMIAEEEYVYTLLHKPLPLETYSYKLDYVRAGKKLRAARIISHLRSSALRQALAILNQETAK